MPLQFRSVRKENATFTHSDIVNGIPSGATRWLMQSSSSLYHYLAEKTNDSQSL